LSQSRPNLTTSEKKLIYKSREEMPSLKRIPFLLAIILTLTQVTAGFPQPIDVLDPSEEEHVFPPLESTNGTLNSRSHVAKRFLDDTRACQEIYSRLDPQKYFNSKDTFIPRFAYSVKCEGTPSDPPACGVTGGRMRCLTRTGRVEFMRIPSGIGQCFRRRRVVISDVPVGCYCV